MVLVTDGPFMMPGRDADPSDEQIENLEGTLSERGLSGWLLVMEGEPSGGAQPRLLQVRTLAEPETHFENAVGAFVENYGSAAGGLLH